MSVLVYTESENNKFKKSSFEALSYGKALADKLEVKVFAVVINCSDTDSLNAYGPDKILKIESQDLDEFSCSIQDDLSHIYENYLIQFYLQIYYQNIPLNEKPV